MANGFSSDHEGEVPVTPTDAEITLKKLLDKQLSTTGRLEQVDFQEATESMHYVGYGSSGLASLSDFLKNELAHKQLIDKARSLRTALHEKGYSKEKVEEMCQNYSCIENDKAGSCEKALKRKRYGADPLFVTHAELEELDITTLQKKYSTNELTNDRQEGFGRHAKELEASLLRGKERLQAIAHLSGGGSSCRKPLIKNMEHGKLHIGLTPQDRARLSGNQETSRTACEVFLKSAPEVLDLHTYLDQRSNNPGSPLADPESSEVGQSEPCILNNEEGRISSKGLLEVTEQEIICNRLSQEEIRELPGGKFTNYSPGNPSHVLYIKNLSADVTQADLAALFLRFQSSGGQQLMFRLMQRGRMKGQAFVTFSDKDTASRALQLINGYKLKGRPMVIEFGRVNSHG